MGNKNMSLSLLALLASSDPQNPFLIASSFSCDKKKPFVGYVFKL
jgi:hypothetical protein